MARSVLKNISKKGIPVTTYHPRSPNVKILSQDISESFAKMRLTPSQSDVGNSKKKKKKASSVTKQKRSPKITSKVDKFAKTSASHSHADVFPPAIPNIIYAWLEEIVKIKKDPNWQNDSKAHRSLLVAECGIRTVCRCLRDSMPIGWEYKRELAESLIVGYETIFEDDEGYLWIV